MTAGPWTLTIDTRGRPLLTNAADKMHPQKRSKIREDWRDDCTKLARAARIPRLPAIRLTVFPVYPDRRSLPDCDAPAPTVKGCLDGLVNAGVIEDDKPPFVAGVDYRPAEVRPGCLPGLVLIVASAPLYEEPK